VLQSHNALYFVFFIQDGVSALSSVMNQQSQHMVALDKRLKGLYDYVCLERGSPLSSMSTTVAPDANAVYTPEANLASGKSSNPWECLNFLGYPASTPEEVTFLLRIVYMIR